jgi:hypothetical protein
MFSFWGGAEESGRGPPRLSVGSDPVYRLREAAARLVECSLAVEGVSEAVRDELVLAARQLRGGASDLGSGICTLGRCLNVIGKDIGRPAAVDKGHRSVCPLPGLGVMEATSGDAAEDGSSSSVLMSVVPELIGRRRVGGRVRGRGGGGWVWSLVPPSLPSGDEDCAQRASAVWGSYSAGSLDASSLAAEGVAAGVYWGDDEEGWGDVAAAQIESEAVGPVHRWASILGGCFMRPSPLCGLLERWGERTPSDDDVSDDAGDVQGWAAKLRERLGTEVLPSLCPEPVEIGCRRWLEVPWAWCGTALRTVSGRAGLVEFLNAQRGCGGECNGLEGLLIVSALFCGALDGSLRSEFGDLSEGEQLIPLGLTFWARAGPRRVFVNDVARVHPSWSSREFWEACLLRSVRGAVEHASGEGVSGTAQRWGGMSDAERTSVERSESAAITGQVGSYAVAMREYGLPASVGRPLLEGMARMARGDDRDAVMASLSEWE